MTRSSISASEPGGLRRLARSAVLGLAGLAAAVLVAEAFFWVVAHTPLRAVLPVPEVSLYGPDPDAGYRHRAGASGLWLQENRTFVEISPLGLRDRERPVAPAGPRALVVGNSFVEALQVPLEDTAVRRAEIALAESLPGAEAVNLGLAGARPAVLVERLRAIGLPLRPAAAVVAVDVAQLASGSAQDDSEFAGYRRGEDGRYRVAYGFRETRGYRFRTGLGGRVMYALLDHSAVVLILNNRKNVGLLAEWPKPAVAREPAGTCADRSILDQEALWLRGLPADQAAVRDAFLADLGTLARDNGLPVVLAITGIGDPCAAPAGTRERIVAAITSAAATRGMGVLDVEAQLTPSGDPGARQRLYGFGRARGGGHLNEEGNRRYGEILAAALRPLLEPARKL